MSYFNSHTHVECDYLLVRRKVLLFYFNSRTLVECDHDTRNVPPLLPFQLPHSNFNSHTRVECDAFAVLHFNSHTHIGCDTAGIPSQISIPTSARDASSFSVKGACWGVFQFPRPCPCRVRLRLCGNPGAHLDFNSHTRVGCDGKIQQNLYTISLPFSY